jgi:hypothetical protein
MKVVHRYAGEVVHRYVPLTDRYRITGRAHRPVGHLMILIPTYKSTIFITKGV